VTAAIDGVIQVGLLPAFVAALGMGFFSMWQLIPHEGWESLQHTLKRVSGRKATLRSGPPAYTVHVDGQLLYASGKEDVQDLLGSTMLLASRQVLRLVNTEHAATIVVTGGTESIVIEVHLDVHFITTLPVLVASRHSRESGNPGDEGHGDWMPAFAGMTFYWRPHASP
jgi:hypothetical protein